jgi:hypothetical protein
VSTPLDGLGIEAQTGQLSVIEFLGMGRVVGEEQNAAAAFPQMADTADRKVKGNAAQIDRSVHIENEQLFGQQSVLHLILHNNLTKYVFFNTIVIE